MPRSAVPLRSPFRLLLLSCLLLPALLSACFRQSGSPQEPQFEVTAAEATSATSFELAFRHPLGDGSDDPSHYLIRDPDGVPLPVVAAYPSVDGTRVTLTTEPQRDVPYRITVRGVVRSAGGRVVDEAEAPGEVIGSTIPAPAVDAAIALSNTRLLVVFSDPATETPANLEDGSLDPRAYIIVPASGGEALGVTAAEFSDAGDDRSRVLLTTAPMTGEDYRLTVGGVRADPGGRPLDPFRSEAPFRGIAARDGTPPSVIEAYATSNTTLVIAFSEPVSDNAADPSRYTVEDAGGNTLAVSAAEPGLHSTRVILTTSPMTDGADYTVAVAGIRDRNGNAIGDGAGAAFTGVPPGASGADTTPPRVTGATSTGATRVVVAFSEVMRGGADGAEDPGRYSIVGSDTLDGSLTGQAILTVTGATLAEDGRSVVLTTLTQSEIAYTLRVTNVADLAGNSVIGPDRDRPDRVEFFGAPATGEGIDSDADGLGDAEEQRGWTVTIVGADDDRTSREVTSDPFDPDSDADGIGDRAEKTYRIDPRDPDSDDDELSDARELNEIYSEPTKADGDGDGLGDGLEVDFFTTSPLYADTDGDQFMDGYEVTTDNRNPRIADLPVVEIEVGNVDLQLDVRFEEQSSEGTTTVDSKNVSTTLERSEASRREHVQADTDEWFVSASASVCVLGGCSVDTFAAGGELTVNGGFTRTSTTTNTTESSRATQEAYARSLTTEAEVSAEASVTRIVEAAGMAVAVTISNPGNVAYTVSDIEITALTQSGRDATSLVPVATLFAASDGDISIGPLNPTRGPFRFVADRAFPQLVEQLMQNPRGITFKIANYTLEDEFGRRFAFVQQDVNDRTAALKINYAGNRDLELYQVATNAGFTPSGAPTGVSMASVLEGTLGLEYVPEAVDRTLDPTVREDADLIDASYSTRMVDGVEVLYRVRDVSRDLTGEDRDWYVFIYNGSDTRMITPVDDNPGRDFRSVTVLAEADFAFYFVQDLDGDALQKTIESTYGSVDSTDDERSNACFGTPDAGGCDAPDGIADSRDSDRDGIDDYTELEGPFVGNDYQPWTIRFDDGRDAYQTSANPARADSDFDGLTDCQELVPTGRGTVGGTPLPCSEIVVYLTADGLATLDETEKGIPLVELARLVLPSPTDPADIDTDDDGLTDLEELLGFTYQGLDGRRLELLPDAAGPSTNPLSRDTDNDNLDDLREIRLRSNPTEADGPSVFDDDGDGLVNLQETSGWDVTWVDGTGERTARDASDPDDPDSDDDGLSDWEEHHGCRDLNRDFACDDEDRFGPTRPNFADSDADGLGDRAEADGVDFPGDGDIRFTDPLDIDSDDDDRSDGVEVGTPWTVTVTGRGGERVYSDPLLSDADGDGLDDSAEETLGSHPGLADTDGDSALDDLEATRATDPLTPDHYITVIYLGLQAGKGSTSADTDCDDGRDPGDFYFSYNVGVPTSTGLSVRGAAHSSTVGTRDCTSSNDGGPCRNDSGQIQLASPFRLNMNVPMSFPVPFTDIFTIEGRVQELDAGGADVTYDFGGIGSAEGIYSGSSLSKGTFAIAFNDPPTALDGRTCQIEVTVQVQVE